MIYIFISAFFVASAGLKYVFSLLFMEMLSSGNSIVCFCRKAFLKSDTAAGLTRSVSLILCITLVSFINVYDEYFCNLIWLSAISTDVI